MPISIEFALNPSWQGMRLKPLGQSGNYRVLLGTETHPMPQRIPSLRLHKPSGRAVVTLDGKDEYCGSSARPRARSNISDILPSR